MKPKLHFFLFLICPMLSGCFTHIASHEVIQGKSDCFFPAAIYKSSDGSLAVEGTLSKNRKQIHAYLMIPQKVLVEAHKKTNGEVSMTDINSLPPSSQKQLQLQKELPSDYRKVVDIPKGQGGMMSVNQRKTINIVAIGALPFAFIIDAVTFPLQIEVAKGFQDIN